MGSALYSFLITSLAGFSTLLGAILIFFKFKDTDKLIGSSLAFAAGVMITISITDLIPSSIIGILKCYYLFPGIIICLIFIVVGILISILINKILPNIELNNSSNNTLFKVGLISMIAIILHNVPEGIATFVSSTKDISLGISLAIAISLHNIPEGISISIPIYYATKSKLKALLYTFVSGISEPIGAIIAYLFLSKYVNDFIMSILLSVIAGIMISIAFYELLPTSLKYKNTKQTIEYFLIGSLFMLICHLFL